jgi:hypothetical protein
LIKRIRRRRDGVRQVEAHADSIDLCFSKESLQTAVERIDILPLQVFDIERIAEKCGFL